MTEMNYSTALVLLDQLRARAERLIKFPTEWGFRRHNGRSQLFNSFLFACESNGSITLRQYLDLRKEYDLIQEQVSAFRESLMACTDGDNNESAAVTPSVQPEASAIESNSTPGAVRLYPLLAEHEQGSAGPIGQVKTFPISASFERTIYMRTEQ